MLQKISVRAALAALALVVQLAAPTLAATADSEAAPNAGGSSSLAGDFLVASAAQRKGDWPRAALYYDRALKLAPDIAGLRGRSIVAALMSGDVDGALALTVSSEAELGPGPTAMLTLGRTVQALRAGRYTEAAATVEGLSGLPLDHEISTALRIIALTADGQVDRANALLEGLRAQGGRGQFASMLQAMLADLAGDAAKAARLYSEVDAASPTLRTMVGRISTLKRAGDTVELDKFLDSLQATQGESVMVAELVARARAGSVAPLVESSADAGAEVLYDLAIGLRGQAPDLSVLLAHMSLYLRPAQPLVWMLMAETAEERERADLAVSYYGQAIDSAGQSSALGWLLRQKQASARYQGGDIEVAIADLRAMTGERTERAEVYAQLGNMLRWQSQFAEAITAYDHALAIQGDDWRLHYYRGIARHERDQWPGAEADLLRALELRADDPFVLNFLGYSWIERGQNLERAKGMIEKAVELRPEDGYMTDSLGWAYYQMGDFQRAVNHLERAVELEPYDPVINDHLGDAYWRTGRLNEARFQWRRAINESKDDSLSSAARAKLDNGLDG
jgi:tetratricopeptide (TPR) repeat protein